MKENWGYFAFGVTFLVTSSSLQNDFVHDDIPAIVRNPDVQGQTRLAALFANDFWGKPMAEVTSHKSYRPLTVFSFRVNRGLFGVSPLSFHVVNVLLHCWLVQRFFSFLRSSGACVSTALVASLLFGLHPLNSESVSNCVGRAEILSAHFFLSAIQSRGDSLSSGGFAFLAMLSKEGGVFSLAVLCGIELVELVSSPRCRDDFFQFACKVGLWLGYLLIFTSLRLWILNGTYPIFTSHDNPGAHAPTILSRYGTISYYWFVHYWLLFCPRNLAYDWAFGSIPLLESVTDLRFLAVAAFLLMIALVAFAVIVTLASPTWSYLKKLDNQSLLAFMIMFFPFIPASNVLVTVGFAVAERVMYTPSMGFAIIVSQGLRRLKGYGIPSPLGCSNSFSRHGALAIILLIFGTKFIVRSACWSSKEALFKSGVTVHRLNAKMFYNLANVYRDKNMFRHAEVYYKEAIRLHPVYAKAYDNLGAIYDDGTESGFAKAEEMYQLAIEASPHHPSPFCNLANLYTIQQRFSDAVKTLLMVKNYDTHYYTATIKLAKIMHKRGFDQDAELLFQHILLLFKLDEVRMAEPYNHYGNLLTELKRYEDAMKVFEQAIQLDPANPDPLVNLAWVKQTIGLTKEAEKIYTKALEISPLSVPALMRLGSLKLQQGRKTEAEHLYERARKLEPENLQIALEESVVLAQRNITAAIRILEEARVRDPRCAFPELHINLAKLFGYNIKRVVQAASILENCNAKMHLHSLDNDVIAEVKYHLGAMYEEFAKKQRGIPADPASNAPSPEVTAIAKAKSMLMEAIDLKPGDADYRVLLAQIHLRRGELEVGESILQRALKIHPSHEVALILMNKVKQKQAEINKTALK